MPINAPGFAMTLGGRPAPADLLAAISRIRFSESYDGASTLEIALDARDPESGAYDYAGTEEVAPGTEVVLSVGDGRDLEPFARYWIARERTSYRDAGASVRLEAYDAAIRLGANEGPRVFGPTSTVAIARAMADDADLVVTAESVDFVDIPEGWRKAAGTSDLAALADLANARGLRPPFVRYDSTLGRDVLFLRRPDARRQGRIPLLRWDGQGRPSTLFSFDPDLDLAGVPVAIEIAGWDEDRGEAWLVTGRIGGGSAPVVQRGGRGRRVDVAAGSSVRAYAVGLGADARERIDGGSIRTEAEARAFAEAWIATRNAAYLEARATAPGFREARVETILSIQGVAPHHAGLYLVEGAEHTITGSTWDVDLDLSRVVVERARASGGAA